jgi:hypothetical protein
MCVDPARHRRLKRAETSPEAPTQFRISRGASNGSQVCETPATLEVASDRPRQRLLARLGPTGAFPPRAAAASPSTVRNVRDQLLGEDSVIGASCSRVHGGIEPRLPWASCPRWTMWRALVRQSASYLGLGPWRLYAGPVDGEPVPVEPNHAVSCAARPTMCRPGSSNVHPLIPAGHAGACAVIGVDRAARVRRRSRRSRADARGRSHRMVSSARCDPGLPRRSIAIAASRK